MNQFSSAAADAAQGAVVGASALGENARSSALRDRVSYVDAAKGLAVALVVLYHASDPFGMSEPLALLRMPLFFFAAGLFAGRGLDASWREFFRTRVGQIFWLFVVWSLLVYYTTTGLKEAYKNSLSINEVLQPFNMFVEPPLTLWFLYALGVTYVFAKLVRRIDWRIVVGLSVIGYCVAVNGAWSAQDPLAIQFQKTLALAPFFLIATYKSQIMRGLIERRSGWGWPGIAIYFLLSFTIITQDLSANPLATFAASTIGILALLMLLERYKSSRVVSTLCKLGSRSLFVFALHRIPLFYFYEVLDRLSIPREGVILIIGALAIVAGCWFVGEYVLSRYAPWTMRAPWLLKAPPAPKPLHHSVDVPRP